MRDKIIVLNIFTFQGPIEQKILNHSVSLGMARRQVYLDERAILAALDAADSGDSDSDLEALIGEEDDGWAGRDRGGRVEEEDEEGEEHREIRMDPVEEQYPLMVGEEFETELEAQVCYCILQVFNFFKGGAVGA